MPPETNLSDPTLAVAERQLVMLAELAEMTMAASRAFTLSALASARAEERFLADEYFMPEVGRAAACGAKAAAESLQKVSRAVRLTLKLEMTVAEIVRDIHAGIVTHIDGVAAGKDAGEPPAVPLQPESMDRRRPAGSSRADAPDRERLERDHESLVEFDRPDRLPRGAFQRTVDLIGADLDIAAKDADEAAGAPADGTRSLRRSAGGLAGSYSDDRAIDANVAPGEAGTRPSLPDRRCHIRDDANPATPLPP